MKSLSFTPTLVVSALAHNLPELSISKRDRHNAGATNHFRRSVGAKVLPRQDGTVGTNIFDIQSWSAGGAYYTNVTVGTPPQEQVVILDTGSSDLYFDASSARTCQTQGPNSCQGGTFDPSRSSTYKEVAAAPAFNTTFGDGSTAIGPYGNDVIGIGNQLISPVQFGVANEVDSTTGYAIGLLGVGYSTNEAVQSLDSYYPNMPEVLKNAGVINSRLYSVYLNDPESSGTILFGGIDRSKFTGNMATVNLLPALVDNELLPVVNQFVTTVTGANATVGGRTSTLWQGGSDGVRAYNLDNVLPVLLDTGSTAWSLPREYFREVARVFDYIHRDGTTECKHADSGDSLSLEFAGKITVQIDARSFIVPLIDPTTREQQTYTNGQPACVFLLEESQGNTGFGFETLGDAILRGMYVVFDLDNGQASLAQANINSTAEPDVVAVEAGPNGVARALGSGVVTAAPNSFSIAAQISATASFVASTAATPIGTATGNAAIPGAGQEASGTQSGAGPDSSEGAASGVLHVEFGAVWLTAAMWVAGMAIGVGAMA